MKWPMVKLGDVVTVNPRLPKDVNADEEVSFVAMASASEEGSLLNEEIRVLSETKKGFTYFEKRDVLLAKITPCFENGKCLRPYQISNDIGFGSTEFHVLRSNESEIDPMYLFYMVWSERFRALGEHSMSGAAGQKRVSADFLRQFEIPLPPLEEQKRIAAILDKADAIRRKRQQAIDLADEFLRSVFLDMFGDVSKFDLIEIKEVASKSKYSLSSGPFGSSLTSKHYVDEGVIVLRGTNVTSGKMDLSDVRYISEDKAEELKRSAIYPGDVVIVAVGASGRALSIPGDMPPAVMSQNFNKVTPNVDIVNPTYLEFCFNSTLVQRQFAQNTTDTVRTFLSLSKIKEVKIPVPPISLQKKFEEIFNETKCQITKINNASFIIDSLVNSLSQKAFSGEL